MSKFKVGDKVRVTGNTTDHDFQIGQIVSVTEVDRKDTTIPYECEGEGERYFLRESDIEPATPLTFNHSLALQGSPVYSGGKRVHPVFCLEDQMYCVLSGSNYYTTWDKEGVNQYPYNGYTDNLTTIPPEVYVEESRWVWVAKNGDTSPLYRLKHIAESMIFPCSELCEVKIKVKK